jgi:hypothetical protein
MAEKLTDRTAKTSNFADGDLVHVVDVSDTSQDPAGSSFKSTIGNIYGSYLAPKITSAQIVTNAADTYSLTLADTVSSNHYLFLQTASGDPFVSVTVTSYSSPKDGAILVMKLNRAGTDDLTIPGFSAGTGFEAGVYTARYSTSLASWLPVNYLPLTAITDLQTAYDGGNDINGADFIVEGGLTGIGTGALSNNSGGSIVALGNTSGRDNTGSDNVFIGRETGDGNDGTNVVAVGTQACQPNTGSNVISIGEGSAANNTGSNVVSIGQLSGTANALSNSFIIGNSELPTYANHAAAVAAITVVLGGSAGSTYLYHNQATDSIGAVRL